MQVKFKNVYIRPLNGLSMPKRFSNSILEKFESYHEIASESVILNTAGDRDNLIGIQLIDSKGRFRPNEIFLTANQMQDFVDKFNNAPLNHTITIS